MVKNFPPSNLDAPTVQGFGDEWKAFDQADLPPEEAQALFDLYFNCFRWDLVDRNSTGFDMGCGSGRWAKLLAPRVGHLHCIDPSEAIEVARKNLANLSNVSFHRTAVDAAPLAPGSMDFGISLGVLHHVPDTAAAIKSCVAMLRPGAPLLLYLYYRFDNRRAWYRALWEISEFGRRIISHMTTRKRIAATSIIAAFVYWPLARFAKSLSLLGFGVRNLPLSFYKDSSFYTMRTDALDRFGTRLEKRFTRKEIADMLSAAGCAEIQFSSGEPYWCVCAIRTR